MRRVKITGFGAPSSCLPPVDIGRKGVSGDMNAL